MGQSIKIRMLASGSSGNSVFVRAAGTRLLVDAGISYRRIDQALCDIDEDPAELDAVLLSHEHTDHTRGLARLFKMCPDVSLFCSQGTLEDADDFEPPARVQTVAAGRPFRVDRIEVTPFELMHDAAEPCGFRLEAPGFSLGVATDLGAWDEQVVDHLSGCRALVIEANHDADMLRRGPYPAFLKRRIAGRLGHLSNDQARALLSRVASAHLEWVILAHLSQKNNSPESAVSRVSGALDGGASIDVLAAGPEPGRLIEMAPTANAPSATPRQGILL